MSISSKLHFTNTTQMPQGLAVWLNCDSPLTDRLKNLSGDAKLKLLSQAWVRSQWWDKYALGLDELIFQREIFMKSHGEIYWYARTIIPASCHAQAPAFFNRLEKESIRKLIFNEPLVQLKQRVIYPINTHAIEFHWMRHYLPNLEGRFWVRLAEFLFQNTHSFYLVEILFPQLEEIKG